MSQGKEGKARSSGRALCGAPLNSEAFPFTLVLQFAATFPRTKVSRRDTPALLRVSDIKPRRSINRPSQQPLRGHKNHASDKLVERGAAAPRSGNRASKWYGAIQIPYAINAGSNRIDAINGSPPRSFGHDANGSVTNDGKNQYVYDVRGRLKQTSSVLGTTGYEVNAQGERVRKSGPNGDRIYHYDRSGKLIAEGTPQGVIDREYIYLHDLPVAVIVE